MPTPHVEVVSPPVSHGVICWMAVCAFIQSEVLLVDVINPPLPLHSWQHLEHVQVYLSNIYFVNVID